MDPLERLLQDNADPSDTRYDILTEDEVDAIEEAIEIEMKIDELAERFPPRPIGA